MQLPALIVSDLHLVASPSTEYRWGLFPWLATTIREERAKTLLILGDLTDSKDFHPSELVNRIVLSITDLQRDCPGLVIRILTGNHDWLKDSQEYFRFLNVLGGVTFITDPWECPDVKGPSAMFLPYTKTPLKDWSGMDFSHYDYLFMHQTVRGAISSNGQEMEGEELPKLNAAKVYSGDIHVPQIVKTEMGTVEYVGSPYHVHFGDNFKPRAVLLEKGGRAVDLHFKTIKRVAVKAEGIDDLVKGLLFTKKGDHIKVTLKLAEADKHEWPRIRREVTEILRASECEVHGLKLEVVRGGARLTADAPTSRQFSPEQSVLRFVERESLTPDAFDVAMEIVDEKN